MKSIIAVVILSFSLHLFAFEKPHKSVLIIGWDGTRLNRLQELLKAGKLPVLSSLIKKGSFVSVNIKTKTDTKAGWAETLTGYDYTVNLVRNNRFYDSIPLGLTIFERLKAKYGTNLTTIFLAGKSTHLGNRGPHNVCQNCVSRTKDLRELMEWWNEEKAMKLDTVDKRPRHFVPRGGEPYFNAYNAKAFDIYKNDLKAGDNVLKFANQEFEKLKDKPFFAFIHFQEPDEEGHLYGEHSSQYSEALIANDKRLGEFLKKIEQLGLNKNLRFFVLSDHGFDIVGSGRPDDLEHDTNASRDTFLVSDRPLPRNHGERFDIAATVLKIFGIDPTKLTPPLVGKSYL